MEIERNGKVNVGRDKGREKEKGERGERGDRRASGVVRIPTFDRLLLFRPQSIITDAMRESSAQCSPLVCP